MPTDNTISDAPPNPEPKKPYEKPTFRFEQVFVTAALHCVKIGSESRGCSHRPSAS